MEEPARQVDPFSAAQNNIKNAQDLIKAEIGRSRTTWFEAFSTRVQIVLNYWEVLLGEGRFPEERTQQIDERAKSLLKSVEGYVQRAEGQKVQVDERQKRKLLRALDIFKEPEEDLEKIDYLEKTKIAIAEAEERINAELERGAGNNWFSCFNTVASGVLGYLELAAAQQDLSGEDVENWNKRAQVLKDEIEKRRQVANAQGASSPDIDEEDRLRLLDLLDIFKEPDVNEQ